MISVTEAIARIVAATNPKPAQVTPIDGCLGRVLRATITAPEDLPRTDRSTMDGYAVRADEVETTLRVLRRALTNDPGVENLPLGAAVRVATGTAIRCGQAVRVIPQELVRIGDGTVTIPAAPAARDHLHRHGSDAKAGDTLIRPGTALTPGALAMIASLGMDSAPVTPPLRILHFTTGDEVVPPGHPLPPGAVYDANGPLISALLAACGETSVREHLAEDYPTALNRVRQSFAHGAPDLLLISGGAGPGAGDFTEKLLLDLGYDLAVLEGVRVRPGKPLLFGVRADGAIAFGLPGNPLSHWASFHTFVSPALAALRGETLREIRITATISDDVPGLGDARPTLHPAIIRWENGVVFAELRPWSASGNVRVMAEANAIVTIPPDTASLRAGDTVSAQILPSLRRLL